MELGPYENDYGLLIQVSIVFQDACNEFPLFQPFQYQISYAESDQGEVHIDSGVIA